MDVDAELRSGLANMSAFAPGLIKPLLFALTGSLPAPRFEGVPDLAQWPCSAAPWPITRRSMLGRCAAPASPTGVSLRSPWSPPRSCSPLGCH